MNRSNFVCAIPMEPETPISSTLQIRDRSEPGMLRRRSSRFSCCHGEENLDVTPNYSEQERKSASLIQAVFREHRFNDAAWNLSAALPWPPGILHPLRTEGTPPIEFIGPRLKQVVESLKASAALSSESSRRLEYRTEEEDGIPKFIRHEQINNFQNEERMLTELALLIQRDAASLDKTFSTIEHQRQRVSNGHSPVIKSKFLCMTPCVAILVMSGLSYYLYSLIFDLASYDMLTAYKNEEKLCEANRTETCEGLYGPYIEEMWAIMCHQRDIIIPRVPCNETVLEICATLYCELSAAMSEDDDDRAYSLAMALFLGIMACVTVKACASVPYTQWKKVPYEVTSSSCRAIVDALSSSSMFSSRKGSMHDPLIDVRELEP